MFPCTLANRTAIVSFSVISWKARNVLASCIKHRDNKVMSWKTVPDSKVVQRSRDRCLATLMKFSVIKRPYRRSTFQCSYRSEKINWLMVPTRVKFLKKRLITALVACNKRKYNVEIGGSVLDGGKWRSGRLNESIRQCLSIR